MPKEYIEREKAKELIKNFGKGDIEDGMKTLDSVDDIILISSGVDLIPAADVVEVKHGKWIDNYNGTFICSVCGGKSPNMNFCGRCGAKMDGKDGI